MLSQNIVQVYINQKDEITVANGEFEKLSAPVKIESVSISMSEAKQVIKALKELVAELDKRTF